MKTMLLLLITAIAPTVAFVPAHAATDGYAICVAVSVKQNKIFFISPTAAMQSAMEGVDARYVQMLREKHYSNVGLYDPAGTPPPPLEVLCQLYTTQSEAAQKLTASRKAAVDNGFVELATEPDFLSAPLVVDAGQPVFDAGSPSVTDAGPNAFIDAGEVVVVDAGIVVVADSVPKAIIEAPKKMEPVAAEPEKKSEPIDLSFLLPETPGMTTFHYDFSAVYSHQNFGFSEGPMLLTGAHFIERNSGLGKMTVFIVTQLIMAMGEVAASQPRYLGSTYSPGYRTDYYAPPASSQELAQMRQSREEAGDELLSSNMSLDLQLYWPLPGISTSSGLSVELTPVTFSFGHIGIELAAMYTRLTDVVPGSTRLRTYENLGGNFRIMGNWQFVNVALQYSLNGFGGFGFGPATVQKNYDKSLTATGGNIFYNNNPLSLSISLHPFRYLFVRGTGSWNKFEFNANSLGFQLEAGVRL